MMDLGGGSSSVEYNGSARLGLWLQDVSFWRWKSNNVPVLWLDTVICDYLVSYFCEKCFSLFMFVVITFHYISMQWGNCSK